MDDSHLELLSKKYQERFSNFSPLEHQLALFLIPFTFNVAKVEENLQMELLKMQSNSALKAKYLEVGMAGLFLYLHEKF